MQNKNSFEKIRMEFLPNPAGEDEGLGHAGIQTYRNDPYAGAARETGQNSRDASVALPVRISYDLLEIPRESIPSLDVLQAVIETCLGQSAGKEKESAFFKQALKVAKGDTLKILRIADFNTTGARGPATTGTPFHSLVKSSGVSVKENAASGGSFGIGKNAVFAVSDLQTVFYSTVYEENGEKRFLAQGKAILVSHTGADGQPKRQVGYWGLEDFREINNQADVPEWLRRDEVGTSLFIIGFRETPNWQRRITFPLIQNFFPAIHKSEMEFSLDQGRYQIGSMSLASLFKDPDVIGAVQETDREQEFGLSENLYRCLVSSDAKEEVVSLPSLGRILIRVLVEEGLPKKVVIVRNGMVITDSLEHFGDRFVRFPMYRDFVAVVMPLDDEGSAFFKKLEDPRHRELSAEGLADTTSRAKAKTVMKQLVQTIRTAIRTHTLAQFESEVSADEMRRYFAAESEPSANSNQAKAEDPETIRYKVEPRKEGRRPQAETKGTGESGAGVSGGNPGPGPRGGADSDAANPDPKSHPAGRGGPHSIRAVSLKDVRNIKPANGSARFRTIFFTPEDSGLAEIAVQATGLNVNDDLSIRSAINAVIDAGRMRRQISANERIRIEVEFDDEYEGPIDIRVNIASETAEEVHEN